MNVLIIGKSARDEAFIKNIIKSPKLDKLFCIPGNPAIARYAECVNIPFDDITSIIEFAKENKVNLVISFDEYMIQSGLADICKQEELKVFAPVVNTAQIATSKSFCKKFAYKHKIPILRYGVFDKENSAVDYLEKSTFPVVIKYDYLAHQDSFVCKSFKEAKNIIEKVFHEAQKKVVIEEFLPGEIITLSVLTDGYQVLAFPYAKEYYYSLDGDGGYITKGVGAYVPNSKVSLKTEKKMAKEIVFPLLDSLQKSHGAYEGFLTFQILLLPDGQLKLLDILPTINIPIATCVFQLVEDDLLEIILSAIEGTLEDYQNFNISNDVVASLALMSGSYPNNAKIGSVVDGIENLDEDNIELFYNDVGMNSDYEIVTTGGRAFFMTARASTLNKAVCDLYNNVDTIQFNGKNYRNDIGKSSVSKEF